MANIETTLRREKRIRVNQVEPKGILLGYILLPMGYSYNTEIQRSKKGDILSFHTGGDYRIFSVRKIKVASAEADILCRMRYGITIKRAMQIWQRNAVLEGNSKGAVSTETCLWVIYDEQNPM